MVTVCSAMIFAPAMMRRYVRHYERSNAKEEINVLQKKSYVMILSQQI